MKRFVITLFLFILTIPLIKATENFGLSVKDGKITYHPDAKGNQILDFSYCGYQLSEKEIPVLNGKIFVPYRSTDASAVIQKAIDYISALKPDINGFRGVIQLDSGSFVLTKALKISTSGVVLRGDVVRGTKLIKQGFDRGAVIYIEGKNNRITEKPVDVLKQYVPAGSLKLSVQSSQTFKAGDRILICRSSEMSWIKSIDCDEYGGGISALGWKPGDADLYWDRKIMNVTGDELTLDAPLSMPLNPDEAEIQVIKYSWPGRIDNCGVEFISLESDFNSKYPMDEDHAWTGISIDNAENCWVQKVNFVHFAGSAVILQPNASRITIQDCISEYPVSEMGGLRRQTFITLGQLNLFQRCWSEDGINDFAAGYLAPGPNAFVQCRVERANGFSGAVDTWAPGLLFDVVDVDGHNLSFKNQGQAKNGAGWGTGNSLFWQCSAAEIECYSPDTDNVNRAYGCWAQFSGNGKWEESNNHVQPRSLFYAQLQQRLNRNVDNQARIMPVKTDASSSPTAEVAIDMSKLAREPVLTLKKWILNLVPVVMNPDDKGNYINVDKLNDKTSGVKPAKSDKKSQTSAVSKGFTVENGKILYQGALVTGTKTDIQWWSGKVRKPFISKSRIHLTRFVPGREGFGMTDRIDSVISQMNKEKILVLDHNSGLWYDRRRDDHERIRRRDGDVWAPFYDQPFARSGEGKAWDGLSKYDLTRPNQWYWLRLKEFADKAEQNGKILFNEHFFQHNIIEAGAHWVDCPWRSANNINETGFPEPVNFAGDKRIFVAEMFYDVTNKHRLELYRNFIRHNLNVFADNKNVVHLISAEFTGPLHFVEFWLDVIAEWEKETGKNALVALSTTKDVQDAILRDPVRSGAVDIIDIRYWHYRHDGSAYVPLGGQNLAPRQHARLMKVGKVSFESVYKAVSEYKKAYPDKVVSYFGMDYPAQAWAVLMAGGSCPSLAINDLNFLRNASKMQISTENCPDLFRLENIDTGIIIYSQRKSEFSISIPIGKYVIKHVNPSNGDIKVINKNFKGGSKILFQFEEGVYYFEKN